MKITQIDQKDRGNKSAQFKTDPKRKAPIEPTAVNELFDKGMLEGFSFNPSDQGKPTQSRLRNHSELPISSHTNVSNKDGKGEWVRQDFPSLGVPYGVNAFWVKPLDVLTLSRLHAAQTVGHDPNNGQKAFTMMLDALQPTIKDFDIRNLTIPDYYAHLYWLRLNSYPRSPFTIPWRSKYGNENNTRVTKSNFEFQELQMSRTEYLRYQADGITFPTVRDMETMFDSTLTEDKRWMMNHAQYIFIPGEPSADWMELKIQKFIDMGADAITMITEFADKCVHGVIEQVTVRDDKFTLDGAISYIEDELKTFVSTLEAISGEDNTDVIIGQMAMMHTFLDGRAEELKILKHVKENNGLRPDGTVFEPDMEVVKLATANITMLFP